jgi:hypothetical protein
MYPSARSVRGFTAESSFEYRAASTCLYQNTVRKNIRYNPQVWSLSACFDSLRRDWLWRNTGYAARMHKSFVQTVAQSLHCSSFLDPL